MHLLTPALRVKLKSPLGILIQGSYNETMIELRKLVDREKPSKLISVGDMVSKNLVKHDIIPHVLVVDNKVMRKSITPIPIEVDQTLRVKNPPGTLSDDSWAVMRNAMSQVLRTRVLVDGEEDLLTLVAVLYAPEGSFVVYGQPHEGIVVVRVTKQKKATIKGLVEEMKVVASAPT